MDVRRCTDQKIFDAWVRAQPQTQFTQSWDWGVFQEKTGRSARRYGVFDGGTIRAVAQVIIHQLPGRWQYWYIPRGPVVRHDLNDDEVAHTMRALLEHIIDEAGDVGALSLIIEPAWRRERLSLLQSMMSAWPGESARFRQPQDTQLLDLGGTEEQLLEQMHQKTRYNIRLAEKRGVTVRVSSAVADVDRFWDINTETTQRDQFRSHAKEYYQQMMETLGPSGMARVFIAEYEGMALAANIVLHAGDMATYVHGASSDRERSVMAPYLLQWQQILDAKTAGLKWYDFGGVGSAEAGTQDRWAGITRFKQGFGGTPMNYIGAHTLILRPGWYRVYKLIRQLRSVI
ncbi:MAG: peptidoglycan bridge formation glycyltransferase FemA/FemB family protein [Candidatus Kerfeldbacteria bacterium]|nr:peptidoglycan bridge formation glycyltransferase FemA/FemB family protein [Candidatus Kerfeldbacteria bacterium]